MTHSAWAAAKEAARSGILRRRPQHATPDLPLGPAEGRAGRSLPPHPPACSQNGDFRSSDELPAAACQNSEWSTESHAVVLTAVSPLELLNIEAGSQNIW